MGTGAGASPADGGLRQRHTAAPPAMSETDSTVIPDDMDSDAEDDQKPQQGGGKGGSGDADYHASQKCKKTFGRTPDGTGEHVSQLKALDTCPKHSPPPVQACTGPPSATVLERGFCPVSRDVSNANVR